MATTRIAARICTRWSPLALVNDAEILTPKISASRSSWAWASVSRPRP